MIVIITMVMIVISKITMMIKVLLMTTDGKIR